jgi:hypothetical protein
MSIKLGESQSEKVKAKIEVMSTADIKGSQITYKEKSISYRLQEGEHGGSGVFFNPEGGSSRYGLTSGKKGSLYLSDYPSTCMKEVFQNLVAINASDLDKYYMATLETEKELKIVDITELAPKVSMTANELTGGDYTTTQLLAEKLSPHSDGLQYLSNVTLKPCIVLWHGEKSGEGVIGTKEFIVLSKFEHNGELAEDILVNDLNILVM